MPNIVLAKKFSTRKQKEPVLDVLAVSNRLLVIPGRAASLLHFSCLKVFHSVYVITYSWKQPAGKRSLPPEDPWEAFRSYLFFAVANQQKEGMSCLQTFLFFSLIIMAAEEASNWGLTRITQVFLLGSHFFLSFTDDGFAACGNHEL